MKTYLLKPNVRQAIAKAGETGVAVAYDARAWYDADPDGEPYLMATTPEGKKVPVTVTCTEGVISGELPD